MSKSINKTYLFTSYPKYEQKLFTAMMNYTRVDKESEAFKPIIDDISKRRTTDNMIKVLMSNNVVLLVEGEPLDKSLKVFCATDMKSGNAQKLKVFIDCSNIISMVNGTYVCSNINLLLAYIFDAMIMYIYYVSEDSLMNNAALTKSGTTIFAKLFTYIIDYIYKINSFSNTRSECMFLSAMYYQVNILGKAIDSESTIRVAKDAATISDSEANIIMIDMEEDDFLNIKTFVTSLSKALSLPSLGVDAVVAKWMHIFGTSTVFALEWYPAFAAMIADACTDAYINNQNTIEKIVGANLMADYNKKLAEIGGRV